MSLCTECLLLPCVITFQKTNRPRKATMTTFDLQGILRHTILERVLRSPPHSKIHFTCSGHDGFDGAQQDYWCDQGESYTEPFQK